MPEVLGECLVGQQVNRYGVARKSINQQHVELLRRLAFELQARVAQNDLGGGRRTRQKTEILLRYVDDQRINVVEPEIIFLTAVAHQRAHAQADHPDTQRPLRRLDLHRLAGTAFRGVVGGGFVQLAGCRVLPPVNDLPVNHGAVSTFHIVKYLKAAVKITRGQFSATGLVQMIFKANPSQREQYNSRETDGHRPALRHRINRLRNDRNCRHQPGQYDADRQLIVAVEPVRRDDADKEAAHHAADREHQVVAGEMAGVRLEPGQLAVAHHAGHEESRQVDGHRGVERNLGDAQRRQPRQCAQPDHEQRQKHLALVPAAALEAQDK